jgi:hypothetical protein
MSDEEQEWWYVVYFDPQTGAEHCFRQGPTERSALALACDLLQQGVEVQRIESTRGQRMTREQVEAWCRENRER